MVLILVMPHFKIDLTQNDLLTIANNIFRQKEFIDMHKTCTTSLDLDYLSFGYFWHFLATFGIENGSTITLLIFGDLKVNKTMYNIWIDIPKLKLTWPIWSFFTF